MEYSMFAKKSSATKKETLAQAIKLVKENLESNREGYKVFNILGFGRVMEGTAYYHELDQDYNCVGIEVEVESQFIHDGIEGVLTKEIGFYSIWRGKASGYAPVTFEQGYRDKLGESHKFDNGIGDHITVTKDIFTVEEVQQVVKALNLLPTKP